MFRSCSSRRCRSAAFLVSLGVGFLELPVGLLQRESQRVAMCSLDFIDSRAVQNDAITFDPRDARSMFAREARRMVPGLDEKITPQAGWASRKLERDSIERAALCAVVPRCGYFIRHDSQNPHWLRGARCRRRVK